jgi:Zn finger protein HypA/HybF involved in hydrogenase expression
MNPAPLHRTLEQELNAVLRGVSMECLVCGEFLLQQGHLLACPECGMRIRDEGEGARAGLQSSLQAG